MKKIEALKLKNIVGGRIDKVVAKDGKVVGYLIFDNETNTKLGLITVKEVGILEAGRSRKECEEHARTIANYLDKEYHKEIKNLEEQGYLKNVWNFFNLYY